MLWNRFLRPLGLAAAFVLLPAGLSAQEWTRFRGPNGTGVSEAKTIPVTWGAKDLAWDVPLPGTGHSQPVLWGQKLFVTSALDGGGSRAVFCFDAKTGKKLWEKSFDLPATPKIHKLNSQASASPACDEMHVYAVVSNPEHYLVIALDHQGVEQWRFDLGPYASQHGDGASPIVFGDLLIQGNEQDGKSSLVALDRKTGRVRWETPRRADKVAYSTPCVLDVSGKSQLVFNSQAYGVSAVDALTGKEVWEAPLFTMRSCSSPIVAGGCVFGTCGSGGGGNYLIAIKPGGSGDVSQSHLAYKITKSSIVPYVPTLVAAGGRLFLWTEKGILSCVDAKSGKVEWEKRIGGNFWASPILIRDKLYNASAEGEVVVVPADGTFEILARNPIGEGTHATLAAANETLYIRTFTGLKAVRAKK